MKKQYEITLTSDKLNSIANIQSLTLQKRHDIWKDITSEEVQIICEHGVRVTQHACDSSSCNKYVKDLYE